MPPGSPPASGPGWVTPGCGRRWRRLPSRRSTCWAARLTARSRRSILMQLRLRAAVGYRCRLVLTCGRRRSGGATPPAAAALRRWPRFVVRSRRGALAQSGRAAGVPVVCIGGLTLGGAGKTPTALAVAKLLAAERRSSSPAAMAARWPARWQSMPGIRRAGRRRGPPAGARGATIVARDRAAGAVAARIAGAGVVVMDDGFHSPAVVKNVRLSSSRPTTASATVACFRPGRCAPLPAQLAKADALVVIGRGPAPRRCGHRSRRNGSRSAAGVPWPPGARGGRSVRARRAARAGFRRHRPSEKFFATLAAAGVAVIARRGLPTHRYTVAEAAALGTEAERQNLLWVTTGKDLAGLSGDAAVAPLAERARALPVRLVLDDEDGFARFVRERLGLLP